LNEDGEERVIGLSLVGKELGAQRGKLKLAAGLLYE
jgi:hypothetical protein